MLNICLFNEGEQLALPYLSAYLDSIGSNFQHGANFATGGATIRPQNESWFQNYYSPFSLDIQVKHFDRFKTQTTYLYNQGHFSTSMSSTIHVRLVLCSLTVD